MTDPQILEGTLHKGHCDLCGHKAEVNQYDETTCCGERRCFNTTCVLTGCRDEDGKIVYYTTAHWDTREDAEYSLNEEI